VNGGHGDDQGRAPSDQGGRREGTPSVAAAFAALGTSIAICLALGVVLGIYLDRWWHASPAGLLVGVVLGTAAAVASVISLVRRYL
jgi:F0F1-type ATP synthase assembly protein I